MAATWGDLGRYLARMGLPALGAALPVPGGAAIGAMIAKQLGAAEASPDVIMDAIEADPDALVEIRRIEADMAARDALHGERMAATAAADTRDARASTRDDTMRRRLALPILFSPFLVLALYAAFPDRFDTSVLFTILGLTGGWAAAVVGFYFGTSIGSAKRAEEISKMKG